MTTERPRSASAQADSTDATSFTRSGGAWAEVSALSDGAYRIRLGGMLRSAWMVGVCNGLAQKGVSIDRAHARSLAHDGSWIAELHVHALSPTIDPLELPVISFAESSPVGSTEPLSLQHYELVASSDHGGTLKLTLSAHDTVGLLGSLLGALASLSLLPVEMHIETRAAEAIDCLWLAATGAAKPSEADRRELDRLLQAALQH